MEKMKFDPNGKVQELIDAGSSVDEVKEAIEFYGHDAGVFVPEKKAASSTVAKVKDEVSSRGNI